MIEETLTPNDKSKRQKKMELYQKLKNLRCGSIFYLLTGDLPPIQYFIDGIIPEMEIVCIYGPQAQFKSTFALHLALSLASGKDTFHFKTNKKANVLWIDEEMGVIGLKDKISKLVKGMNIKPIEIKDSFYYESINGFKLDDDESIEKLRSIIIGKDTDVIFLDSISRIMLGDENKVKDVSKLHTNMRYLCESCGVSFVTIHHSRKTNNKSRKDIDSIRGSSDFANQIDCAFSLTKVRNSNNILIFKQEKGRYGYIVETINFLIDSDQKTNDTYIRLKYGGVASDNVATARQYRREKIKAWIIKWISDCGCKDIQLSAIITDGKPKGYSQDDIRDMVYRDKKQSLMAVGMLKPGKRQGWYSVV